MRHTHAKGNMPQVFLIMGVSGSGKSTIGAMFAKSLGGMFLEGDDLHPASNVAKMQSGQALVDDDRWPWLERIADWIREQSERQAVAVVACSALKRSYRDYFVQECGGVQLVYLRTSQGVLGDRLTARRGHFMPPALLDSQLESLEEPMLDENPIVIDANDTPQNIVAALVARTGLDHPA